MGPYHFARMQELARVADIDLTIVEGTSLDDHGWIRRDGRKDLHLITLSAEPLSSRVLRETRSVLAQTLDESQPDVVVGPGYAEPYSLEVILGYRNRCRDSLALLWSETTALDHRRSYIKESLKSLLVSAFDGALVAGSLHASYLRLLGMPISDIQIVGNCVDNEYFSCRADAVRKAVISRKGTALPSTFLFVGRMLPEKNIVGLLEAYHLYRKLAGLNPWVLVLVGSGPEESSLKAQIAKNKTEGVRFTGLLQPDELPQYYGQAGCFVLPSISEPWGLVVNEATASGIPVLVSNRCGCAPDLVREGQNGFVFDPLDIQALANLLLKVSHGNLSLEKLGMMGKEIVAAYTPILFAQRAAAHIRTLREQQLGQPRSFSARQSLTQMALRGLGAMTTVQERLPAG